jgi:hypothetical protein
MPVILISPAESTDGLEADTLDALTLQRPLPDRALRCSLRAPLNQRFAELHNLLGERNEKLEKHIHLLPLRRRGL